VNIYRLLFVFTVASLLGCAVGQAPYAPPAEVPLQDAPPGQALLYLIRIPDDRITVEVKINGARAAVMPPSTYTAVVLDPGTHTISTEHTAAPEGAREVAPRLTVHAKAGERGFAYLTGSTDSGGGIGVLWIGRSPVLTVPASRRQIVGSREWKQASEFDAQGLMSIAKAVLPQ
jgi:hypothetical protein